ncbi:hypothetical protein EDB84DRAFT_1560440 [Lactarius hengduanensis]|nr:hypothetical protein EDB84DRAFT_1560440 [Lactarius hengduanensis]
MPTRTPFCLMTLSLSLEACWALELILKLWKSQKCLKETISLDPQETTFVRRYYESCRGARHRIFTIELLQLGPLGTHGHANARGFESPIYFIYNYVKIRLVVVTVAAQTWKASIFSQMRAQFDVVAWHGKSVLDCSVVPASA